MTQTNTRVLAAINSVQRAVAAVGIAKNRRNVEQNYAFRGIDDVYNVVGPILANAGLFIIPLNMARTEREYTTAKGTKGTHASVSGHYRWQHVEGECLDIEAFGEAQDFQARAVQKAMSTAYKNMLFSVLCIPLDGSDADDEDSSDHEGELAKFIVRHGLEVGKVAAFAKVDTLDELDPKRIPALIAALTKRLEPKGSSVHRDVMASEKNLTPEAVAADAAQRIQDASPDRLLATWQAVERDNSQVADAAWSLLPSQVRTAIRKAGVRASVQKPELSDAYRNAYDLISAAADEDEVNHALDLIIDTILLSPSELADITVYAQSREFPST